MWSVSVSAASCWHQGMLTRFDWRLDTGLVKAGSEDKEF